MPEPTHEQVARAVAAFTRRDLSQMHERMKAALDDLLVTAKDKDLPFRVRRRAAGEAKVRRQQLELYREIAEQMVEEGALTIGDLGELAVARMCGHGAETEAEAD